MPFGEIIPEPGEQTEVPRLPFLPGFSREIIFFPSLLGLQTERDTLDRIHVPVAFVFHGDLPSFLCQRSSLEKRRCCFAYGLYEATGARVRGRLTGAVDSGPLLGANPPTENERSYTWMLKWSGSHRSIGINTLRALLHANICTGVWNCF